MWGWFICLVVFVILLFVWSACKVGSDSDDLFERADYLEWFEHHKVKDSSPTD